MTTRSANATLLAGMLMLAVAMGIGRFAFTPLLPMMQKDAGMSIALGGWLAAANYVGYLVGAYSAIHLRLQPGRVVTWALFAVALLTAGMGLSRAPALWLLLRGLAGVTSAWVLIYASSLVLHRLAEQRAPGLGGMLFGGVGVGIIIAGLLCLAFLAAGWSSSASWLALGALAAAISLALLPVLRGGTTVPAAPAGASAAAPQGLAPLIVSYGILGFGYIIPATFLPAMARQLVPDPLVFGWAWPVFGAAALVSTLAAGPLFLRFSNLAIWGVCHVVMAAGAALPVLMPGIAGILLAALCIGGTCFVVTAAGVQEARRLAPHAPAPLVAKFTVAFAIGQILGPVCVSLAPAGEWSLHLLWMVAAALLLASGLYLLRMDEVATRGHPMRGL